MTINDPFIQALKAGDQQAFRTLVDTYQQKVLNTALSMLQNQETAEDITQDVFVSVFKTILSFNEKSSVSTWIYRITVNKCLDHLRSAGRQKKAGFLVQLFQKEEGKDLADQPDFIHPGVVLEKREQSKYLFKAINSLQENQKTAFILTHIEDLPQREVAEIMNISVKAVESLLQRAKANLRKFLGDMER